MCVSHFSWIPRAVMNVCFPAGMSMPETSLIGRTETVKLGNDRH